MYDVSSYVTAVTSEDPQSIYIEVVESKVTKNGDKMYDPALCFTTLASANFVTFPPAPIEIGTAFAKFPRTRRIHFSSSCVQHHPGQEVGRDVPTQTLARIALCP